MSSTTLSPENRDALLRQLESLFSLAQVVTSDADEAAELVQATYGRAFASTIHFENEDDARIWLFKLMTTIREESVRSSQSAEFTESASDSLPVGDSARDLEPSSRTVDLLDFRRRLTDEFINRALPQAFSTLSSEQRMLLMLCDVERLRCEEAGDVLGREPLDACAQLDEARIALRNALEAGANSLERELLETNLPADWRQSALKRMIESELVATPPTLGPSIAILLHNAGLPGTARPHSDRPQTSPDQSRASIFTWRDVFRKLGLITGIILTAGLLGYGFTRVMTPEPDRNLISVSARTADSIEPTFRTTSPEQAERYILDRLNVRVTVPTIEGATLQGLSIRTVAENADVPVLLFQEIESGRRLPIYIYTYAFLDRHQNNLVLERDILRQIEDEGNFDLHDLGREKVLIWRHRDDIFLAITNGDAEALRGRIAFPS